MQVEATEKLYKSSNYRKAKELFWINKLQSLKHGLNKKDYYPISFFNIISLQILILYFIALFLFVMFFMQCI